MDDANYPWLVLVPRLPGARELIDLDRDLRRQPTDEIDRAARLLRDFCQPDKLNVAAPGNLVPQLHVHAIAPFVRHPARPAPAWGRLAARPSSSVPPVPRLAALRHREHVSGGRAGL